MGVLILFISGCKPIGYPYMYEKVEISCVKIVFITKSESPNYSYDILIEIEDIQAFTDDLDKLEFHRYLIGDPTDLSEGYRVILIEYSNGNYELIHNYAQARIINGEYYFGKVNCDEQEFNELLDKYLNIEQ